MAEKIELPPGLVVIYGPPGTLKTSIALSWPARVKVYDFDLGSHRAWKFKEMLDSGHVIHRRIKPLLKTMTQRQWTVQGAIELWSAIVDETLADFENPDVSAIMLDTCTLQWKLNCDAFLQEEQRTKPDKKKLGTWDYGEPNRRENLIIQSSKAYGKFLICLHHEADERAPVMGSDGKPVMQIGSDGQPEQVMALTGEKMPDGFKYIRGLADWVFHTRVEKQEVDVNGTKQKKLTPIVQIEKSALGIDLVGMEMSIKTGEPVTFYAELCKRLKMLKRI